MQRNSASDRTGLMRALFPELAGEVDAALKSHGERAPEAEFDEQLDALVDEVLPRSASFDLSDPGAATRFAQTFSRAAQIAANLKVVLPEPEAFAEAGVDFEALAQSLSSDPTLTPIPAPHGLGAATWETAFAAHPDSPGLLLAAEVVREFAILDTAPPHEPVVAEAVAGGGRPVHWTLRLVPAGAQPPLLGLSFAHGPHVTLPEMLMLQLIRVASGETLLDAGTFTWLDGVLGDGRLAARHVYDASEHAVRVNCREIVNQGPHLGARPPVPAVTGSPPPGTNAG